MHGGGDQPHLSAATLETQAMALLLVVAGQFFYRGNQIRAALSQAGGAGQGGQIQTLGSDQQQALHDGTEWGEHGGQPPAPPLAARAGSARTSRGPKGCSCTSRATLW